MSLLYATGVFQVSTGSVGTTQDITCTDLTSDTTFQPKAILMWTMGRTEGTDTVGELSLGCSIGFGTSGSNRYACIMGATDGNATSNGSKRMTDNAILNTFDLTPAAETVDGSLDLDATWPADGFRVIIDEVFSVGVRAHWCAWGGTDITDAVCVEFQEPAATGTQDITTPGFTVAADGGGIVFFISFQSTADPPISNFNASAGQITFGVASGVGENAVVQVSDDQGVTTMDIKAYIISNGCIAMQPTAVGTSVDCRASFNGWITNGFQLNWAERASTRWIAALVIKGGQWLVGNALTQTDTTTDIVESGFAFQPKGGVIVCASRGESTNDVASDNGAMSVGAFDVDLNQHCQAFLLENGTGNEENQAAIEYNEVYANLSTTATVEGLMRVISIESTGFTCEMTSDADPVQCFFFYAAFGDDAAAPSTALQDMIGCGIVPFER